MKFAIGIAALIHKENLFPCSQDIPAVHNPYSQFTPHQVLTGGGEAIKPALQNIPSQLSFPGPPGPVPDSQCSFSSSGNSSTLTPITSQISSTSTAEMLGKAFVARM